MKNRTDNNSVWITGDSITGEKIAGFADKSDLRNQVAQIILDRYGSDQKIEKDENGNNIVVEARQTVSVALENNQIEIVPLGFGHKVASTLANLFNNVQQTFDLAADDKDTMPAQELLEQYRDLDTLISKLIQVDQTSIWFSSAALFIEWKDGWLRYKCIQPQNIQCEFDYSIETETGTRPTDYSDIEDASTVIIETSQVDDTTRSYVGIKGACAEYPRGRYCVYHSRSDGRTIPDPGEDNCWDFEMNGERANPLTVYSQQHPDMGIPEYPISLLYFDGTGDALLPVSDALLHDAREIDVAASHIRSTSADMCRPTKVFNRGPAGATIPRSLDGNVVISDGQKLEAIEFTNKATSVAFETLQSEIIAIASSWSVPDYMVSSWDHTVDSSSGVALKVKTVPYSDLRDKRIRQARPFVDKIFEIEKAFIDLWAKEGRENIGLLLQCTQEWNAGDIDYPIQESERLQAVKDKMEIGTFNLIEAIKEEFGFTDDEGAIAKYEQMKAQDKELGLDEQDIDQGGGDPAAPGQVPLQRQRGDQGSAS